MIAYLRGTVRERVRDWVILEIQSIGYQVYLSSRTNGAVGSELALFCSEQIREDSRRLYGFRTLAERELFELLLAVSGVGPKSALAILGQGSPIDIEAAIMSGDPTFFEGAPGIGKKVALKIIVELKTRFDSSRSALIGVLESEDETLITSLEQLGYKRNEFAKLLRSIPAELTDLEARLTYMLKALGKYQQ